MEKVDIRDLEPKEEYLVVEIEYYDPELLDMEERSNIDKILSLLNDELYDLSTELEIHEYVVRRDILKKIIDLLDESVILRNVQTLKAKLESEDLDDYVFERLKEGVYKSCTCP